LFVLLGWSLLFAGEVGAALWLSAWALYGVVVLLASAIAALRFRSLSVAALALPGFVLTHVVYAVGFVEGAFRR
jgi:hypothetical protein